MLMCSVLGISPEECAAGLAGYLMLLALFVVSFLFWYWWFRSGVLGTMQGLPSTPTKGEEPGSRVVHAALAFVFAIAPLWLLFG